MEDRTIIDPNLPPAMPSMPGGGEATQVIGSAGYAPAYPAPGAGGYEATQQAITATCPVCRTPNPPSERYCQDCGLLMSSVQGDVEALPDASQLPRLVAAATGQEFFLNPGANAVGREGPDVQLSDPTVSRRHAQLLLEAGQLTVEDLGSSNGTFVNGRPVRQGERATAFDGDTLKFGQLQLALTLPGGGARPAGESSETAPTAVAELSAAPPEDRGATVGQLLLDDGTAFPLYAGVNPVGRRSTNQIPIPDAFMSGKHAEIRCDDGTVILVDVGSTNGSFIDGARLAANSPVTLHDGQVFTLGKTRVTYRAGDAPTAAEADATLMAVPAVPDTTLMETQPFGDGLEPTQG